MSDLYNQIWVAKSYFIRYIYKLAVSVKNDYTKKRKLWTILTFQK